MHWGTAWNFPHSQRIWALPPHCLCHLRRAGIPEFAVGIMVVLEPWPAPFSAADVDEVEDGEFAP